MAKDFALNDAENTFNSQFCFVLFLKMNNTLTNANRIKTSFTFCYFLDNDIRALCF